VKGFQRPSTRSPSSSFASAAPPRHQPVNIIQNASDDTNGDDDVEVAKSVTENDDREMPRDGRMTAKENVNVHVRPIAESSDPESGTDIKLS